MANWAAGECLLAIALAYQAEPVKTISLTYKNDARPRSALPPEAALFPAATVTIAARVADGHLGHVSWYGSS